MRLRHPRALEDVPGKPPARVDLGDVTVDVDRENGAIFEASESSGRRLAGRFDLELSDLEPGAEPSEPTSNEDAETCQTVKGDGDVCGRELPCPYHSGD